VDTQSAVTHIMRARIFDIMRARIFDIMRARIFDIMRARIFHKVTTKEVHVYNVFPNCNIFCAYKWFDEPHGYKPIFSLANKPVFHCVNTICFELVSMGSQGVARVAIEHIRDKKNSHK
jgi:hypothetical protein